MHALCAVSFWSQPVERADAAHLIQRLKERALEEKREVEGRLLVMLH
tara:strand:- start:175 stop:315 length:141 start_codon:yes stop_codon:yes gene_type:complete